MSTPINHARSLPGPLRVSAQPEADAPSRVGTLFFWGIVAVLVVAAVVMRVYHLDLPFDRDSYDEGVYWQSLRAMQDGQRLYSGIFYSQPPLFLLSTYPGFVLFGGSLWSARFGIVLVSLLGFGGAYVLGKTLAGRLGACIALLLLLVNPLYLAQSQIIQAEASSVAFTFLAIAFAFLWWAEPDGWRGICWAGLCGLTFVLSVLCKLLCLSTIVPILLLMIARAWQIQRGRRGTRLKGWLPILAGIGIALLTMLAGIAPFLGSFQALWAGVVSFHTEAARVAVITGPNNLPVPDNLQRVLVGLLSLTTVTALYGTLVALLRQDWRVLPILGWLLATLILLFYQQPLFLHHLIALQPPLITLSLLGLARPLAYKAAFERLMLRGSRLALLVFVLAIVLAFVTSGVNFWQDIIYYQGVDAYAAGPLIGQNVRVAQDLHGAIAPDQWVITDGQFIAGLAGRSTPPWLVDTSSVRIQTGYVTLAEIEQTALNPRVHAVLFYTDRFYLMRQMDGFHSWVAAHFHLLRKYRDRQELWVR